MFDAYGIVIYHDGDLFDFCYLWSTTELSDSVA